MWKKIKVQFDLLESLTSMIALVIFYFPIKHINSFSILFLNIKVIDKLFSNIAFK